MTCLWCQGCPTCLTCLVFGCFFDLSLVSGLSHMLDLSLVFDWVFDLSLVLSHRSQAAAQVQAADAAQDQVVGGQEAHQGWRWGRLCPAWRLVVPPATNPPNQVGFLNQNTRRISHVSVYFKLAVPGPSSQNSSRLSGDPARTCRETTNTEILNPRTKNPAHWVGFQQNVLSKWSQPKTEETKSKSLAGNLLLNLVKHLW